MIFSRFSAIIYFICLQIMRLPTLKTLLLQFLIILPVPHSQIYSVTALAVTSLFLATVRVHTLTPAINASHMTYPESSIDAIIRKKEGFLPELNKTQVDDPELHTDVQRYHDDFVSLEINTTQTSHTVPRIDMQTHGTDYRKPQINKTQLSRTELYNVTQTHGQDNRRPQINKTQSSHAEPHIDTQTHGRDNHRLQINTAELSHAEPRIDTQTLGQDSREPQINSTKLSYPKPDVNTSTHGEGYLDPEINETLLLHTELPNEILTSREDIHSSELYTSQPRYHEPHNQNSMNADLNPDDRDLEMITEPNAFQNFIPETMTSSKVKIPRPYFGDAEAPRKQSIADKEKQTRIKTIGVGVLFDESTTFPSDLILPPLSVLSGVERDITKENIQQTAPIINKSTDTVVDDESGPPFILTKSKGEISMFSDITNISISQTMNVQSSNELTSCFQRCGEDATFPCSCDEKCVVHKNCCEDLPNTCPDLYGFATSKFEHLSFASVRCDEMSAVFMIESCPSTSNQNIAKLTDSQRYFDNAPSRLLSKGHSIESRARKISSVSEVLSNAPVTDYDTGIVFANSSIYECNKKATNDRNVNDMRGIWHAQFGTINNQIPLTVIDLQQKIDLSTYSYLPPKSQPVSAGALCYNNWTLACISSRVVGHQVICNMSASEYYASRTTLAATPWPDKILAQYTCALCTLDYQTSPERGDRNLFDGFKLLVSLSEEPRKLSYSVGLDSDRPYGIMPWTSLTCTNPDFLPKGVSDTSCKANKCEEYFLLTPENLCRKAVDAELSIQSEITFNGKKCKIEPDSFADAAKCYLQNLHKIKTTAKPLRVQQDFDTQQQVNLTVIRMDMYFDVDRFEMIYFSLYNMYQAFDTAMSIFVRHHCSTNEMQIGGKNRKENTLSIKSANDEEMPNGNIVNFCIQLYPINASSSDTLNCHLTSESLKNLPIESIKMKGLISKVKSLKCLLETKVDFTSKGSTSCVPPSLPYLIIAVNLFRV